MADQETWRDVDERTLGIIEGIEMYSYTSSEQWAENGVRYVGTTGKTFKEAVAEVLRERGYSHLADTTAGL